MNQTKSWCWNPNLFFGRQKVKCIVVNIFFNVEELKNLITTDLFNFHQQKKWSWFFFPGLVARHVETNSELEKTPKIF